MEDIMNMKQGTFKNTIKQNIEEKAFEILEKTKLSYSKVEHVEHMQYFENPEISTTQQ